MGEEMLDLEHNPLRLVDGGIEFWRERAKLRDCLLEFVHVTLLVPSLAFEAAGVYSPKSTHMGEAIGDGAATLIWITFRGLSIDGFRGLPGGRGIIGGSGRFRERALRRRQGRHIFQGARVMGCYSE